MACSLRWPQRSNASEKIQWLGHRHCCSVYLVGGRALDPFPPGLLVLILMPSLAWGQTDNMPVSEETVLDRTSDPVWLDSLYQSGTAFGQFLDEAQARRERWVSNYGDGTPDDAWTARADRLTGSWYLLAVAIDGCSDSVSTIPYLAHLANYSDQISMRIVLPESGRPIMEAHRTNDGELPHRLFWS